MEDITMPLTWKEKLTPLKVGSFVDVEDHESVQAAYTAIRIHFTESEDADLNKREFTIRKRKVWRTQ